MAWSLATAALLPVALSLAVQAVASRPHVLLVLADDTGWNNLGWHARTNAARAEVSTPALDALVAEGVELDRAIAFKYCSPSRCALQSGRNPIHVNVHNDVFGDDTGIPVQMTCLASKLKLAGYRTIAAGKWHAGMQHPAQTPRGRGYDAALTYFNPDNDYWANTYSSCPVSQGSPLTTPIVDLWEAVEGGGEGPAFRRNNSCRDRTFVPNNGCMDELGRRCASQWDAVSASPEGRMACIRCAMEANITACGAPINQSSETHHPGFAAVGQTPSDIVLRWCDGWRAFTTGTGCRNPHANGSAVYEDVLFSRYLCAAVETHQSSVPLFVFFAPHSAHTPMQAQETTLARFDLIARRGDDKPEHTRQTYTAMVAEGDAAIGDVVAAFRARGLWERTLMVYSSDNGGPSYLNGTSGANNYPLKGGKMSNFDGGLRVGSFISGGVVPKAKRGTKYGGLIGLFDWYTTLCSLAGVSAVDDQAATASLPPVDGLDLSAALLGVVARAAAADEAPVVATHRRELAIGTADQSQRFVAGLYMEGAPSVDGVPGPLYKLLLGVVNQNAHSGPLSPNRTMNATLSFPSGGNVADWTPDAYALDCGEATGCLWDVRADPEERNDLARGSPPPAHIVEVMRLMREQVQGYRAGALMRVPGPPQPAACDAALGEHRGYWGPFSKRAAGKTDDDLMTVVSL